MSDERDYFQRQAESSIRLPRFARTLLGVLVLLGAVFFIGVGGLLLFATDRSRLPAPIGALLLALFMILPGLGMGYVAVKLVRMKQHTEHLMSSRGARITSYITASVGVLMFIGSAISANLEFAIAGVFAALMAYWLHTSAARISGSKRQ